MKGSPYVPPPSAKPEQPTRCKRSCCWSPYGHSPRIGCTCHQPVIGQVRT